MYGRDKELLEACKKGNMYDFIANNAYQFTRDELVEILKQTFYAIYQRLQDQNKEVEQLIPWNLYDYGFFEDLTADEMRDLLDSSAPAAVTSEYSYIPTPRASAPAAPEPSFDDIPSPVTIETPSYNEADPTPSDSVVISADADSDDLSDVDF